MNKKVKPIGSESKRGGFTRIKIAENKWVNKHIYLWEQAHQRKVPSNHFIIFADGNKSNFAIENLKCVSRKEFARKTDKPIGAENIRQGYIFIKTELGDWVAKHVHLWEQEHKQAVPKGHCVYFLDGDKSNFAIDNLACIPKQELSRLVRSRRTVKPIGAEREDFPKKGYSCTRIKISQQEWKAKNVHIWEQAHQKQVPKGHYILFADGDKTNFNIENLQLTAIKDTVRKTDRPLFYERKCYLTGYTKVKIGRNRWVNKQLYIWEQTHKQAVPKGHFIIFLDKNKNNFAPENLMCVSNGELACINSRHGISSNPAITKSFVLIAKISAKLRERLSVKRKGQKPS